MQHWGITLTINWFLLGMKTILSHTHKTGSWYLLGGGNISSHAHKTGSWYLLGSGNISSHTHKTGSWYLFGDFQQATTAFLYGNPPPRSLSKSHMIEHYILYYKPYKPNFGLWLSRIGCSVSGYTSWKLHIPVRTPKWGHGHVTASKLNRFCLILRHVITYD